MSIAIGIQDFSEMLQGAPEFFVITGDGQVRQLTGKSAKDALQQFSQTLSQTDPNKRILKFTLEGSPEAIIQSFCQQYRAQSQGATKNLPALEKSLRELLVQREERHKKSLTGRVESAVQALVFPIIF